jgi:hypothetical protein
MSDDDITDLDEDEEIEGTPVGMIFRWKSRSVELRFDELGPGDDLAARKQIGFPITAMLEHFGSDSVAALWWRARYKAGERKLLFKDAEREFGRLKDEIEIEPIEEPVADDEGDLAPEGNAVASGETTAN